MYEFSWHDSIDLVDIKITWSTVKKIFEDEIDTVKKLFEDEIDKIKIKRKYIFTQLIS